MAVEKYRRKASFADGATFAGSVGFSGPVLVNTTQVFGGATTFNATATFSAAPLLNVPPRMASGSAAYQVSGVTRVGSGLASAVVSTQAINSGGMVHISTAMVGVINATSSTALGIMAVTTVAQAASGGYFALGFTGVGFLNIPLDVSWFIVNP